MTASGLAGEYDEEIFHRLEPRRKQTLFDALSLFESDNLDKSDYEFDGIRRALCSKYVSKTREWLGAYERLDDENVGIDPTVRYIAEEYEVDFEESTPESKYQLALRVLQEGLASELDNIIIGSRIRSVASTKTYTYTDTVNLDGLKQSVSDFHEQWNSDDQAKAVRVKIEEIGDGSIVFHITAERGTQPNRVRVFRFREEDEEMPAKPETMTKEYRAVKACRVYIDSTGEDTTVVLTEGKQRWKRILNALFSQLFDVEDFIGELTTKRLEAAGELEADASEAIQESDDPIEKTRQLIRGHAETAKERVRDSDSLPQDKKEAVIRCLETVEYDGSQVIDDPSVATEEFSLVGREGLEAIFDRVDQMRDSFLDLLATADDENAALVLSIDNRNVAVRSGDYQPTDSARLSNDAQLALKYFFDEEDVV
ncbi:hypothetical protein D3D02_16225 [Halobellus sp. Atlit-38R]|uniref:hypothetical protein n=2 Tax=Haloferacaceae TaxID=1644056 RepID=UPI000EF23FEA|nr:hypothetical protein [Halobellus sp. Atlit-38R]RLM83842.1 hypothetical protein D3D02_16225 [Halobellus sp. Atlit-38R]